MLYFVNQFIYIRYRALSNSSHVNNSASTLSPSMRQVLDVAQVFTAVQVPVVAQELT
ncbi:hypothetical protein J6T66_05830 [bacterium]|nr:hypothetical protein [bacterium]